MTDYTDPESPVADPHAPERLRWKPVYMGEGHPARCDNCHRIITEHMPMEDLEFLCYESYLRIQDGDR